jgi:hypothetical protein
MMQVGVQQITMAPRALHGWAGRQSKLHCRRPHWPGHLGRRLLSAVSQPVGSNPHAAFQGFITHFGPYLHGHGSACRGRQLTCLPALCQFLVA